MIFSSGANWLWTLNSVLGEVTPERIEIARKADDICISMIREARLYDKITQAYAALDPTKAVAVMVCTCSLFFALLFEDALEMLTSGQGDKRVHAEMVILRAVETTDFMTATAFNFPHEFITRVAARITNEVHGGESNSWKSSSKDPQVRMKTDVIL